MNKNTTKIHMQHSARAPRYKLVEEIQAMILQYENQIVSCENTLALSLITQKLSELKRLVKSNSQD